MAGASSYSDPNLQLNRHTGISTVHIVLFCIQFKVLELSVSA